MTRFSHLLSGVFLLGALIFLPSLTAQITLNIDMASSAAAKPRLGLPLGHTQAVTSFHFFATGELVSTGQDQAVHYWDLNSLKWLRMEKHDTALRYDRITAEGVALAFPIGKGAEQARVLSAVEDSTFVCGSGQIHLGNDLSKGISADGKYAIRNNTLQPGCSEWGEPIRLDFTPDGFTPTGKTVYQLANGILTRASYPEVTEKTAVRLEKANEEPLTFFANDLYAYTQVNPDGTTNQVHRLWNTKDGKRLNTSGIPAQAQLTDVSPNDEYLLLTTTNDDDATQSTIEYSRYNVAEGQIDRTYYLPSQAEKTPDAGLAPSRFGLAGKLVIIPGPAGEIYVFNAKTGRLKEVLKTGIRRVIDLYLSPDDTELYLGSATPDSATFSVLTWNWRGANQFTSTTLPKASYANFFATPFGYNKRMADYRPVAGGVDPVATSNSGPNGNSTADQLRVTQSNEAGVACCEFVLTKLVNGQEVATHQVTYQPEENQETSLVFSASASRDTSIVAIGTEAGDVLLFDHRGNFLSALSGHEGRVYDLRFFHHSNRLISASEDGMVKLWDLDLQDELATLVLVDDNDWVVIGPENRYDASQGAVDRLHFVVKTGDGVDEVVELTQMSDRYYDPGLLQKLLRFSEQPLRSVKGLETVDLYPIVELNLERDSFLNIVLTPRSGGIGRATLFINGREKVYDVRPDSIDMNFTLPLNSDEYRSAYLYDNTVSLQVYNQEESLHSRHVSIEYVYPKGAKVTPRGENTTITTTNPAEAATETTTTTTTTPTSVAFSEEVALTAQLHIVCIGTSDYTGSEIDLTFPDQDAIAMSNALYSVGNELFGTNQPVAAYCLTTQPSAVAQSSLNAKVKWSFASKENVQTTLLKLQETTNPQDVVIVFLSGHGKTIEIDNKPQFHYLTNEATSMNLTDRQLLANVAISTTELTDLLKQVPAYKQVVIIDACDSGQAINDLTGTRNLNGSQIRALNSMSSRVGMYLIAGSAAGKVSFEASTFGQGLLTYSLLEGMTGKALVADEIDGKDFYVNVTELFLYAQARVPVLAASVQGIQQPQVNYPPKAGTFALGIFNENTPIAIGDPKPVLVRTNFQSNLTFADEIELEKQVDSRLREESLKGKEAEFVFADTDQSLPNTIMVRGRYDVTEQQTVKVKISLLIPNQQPKLLDIPEFPLDEIAEEIFIALKKALREN